MQTFAADYAGWRYLPGTESLVVLLDHDGNGLCVVPADEFHAAEEADAAEYRDAD